MKLGILGMGHAGIRHARNALALGHKVCGYDEKFHDMGLSGISIEGPDPARVQPMPSRASVLAASEAVIIATPSECHLDDLRTCLAAGKHVLVEKPIALIRQRKEVQKLIEQNAKAPNPLTIAVGLNLRFHPLISELQWQLTSHTNPEAPYYASFTCCQWTESPDALRNGCLETWACHELDLAEYLCGPLRLIDHHVDRFNVNLYLVRWEGPHCHVHIHSDMRARQRLRQVMVCTENRSHVIDLERNPVTDEHYRWELQAFVNRIHGDDSWTLAIGEDGIAALRLAERALI